MLNLWGIHVNDQTFLISHPSRTGLKLFSTFPSETFPIGLHYLAKITHIRIGPVENVSLRTGN